MLWKGSNRVKHLVVLISRQISLLTDPVESWANALPLPLHRHCLSISRFTDEIYTDVSWQTPACTCTHITAGFGQILPNIPLYFLIMIPPAQMTSRSLRNKQKKKCKKKRVWLLPTYAAKHVLPSRISSKTPTLTSPSLTLTVWPVQLQPGSHIQAPRPDA